MLSPHFLGTIRALRAHFPRIVFFLLVPKILAQCAFYTHFAQSERFAFHAGDGLISVRASSALSTDIYVDACTAPFMAGNVYEAIMLVLI